MSFFVSKGLELDEDKLAIAVGKKALKEVVKPVLFGLHQHVLVNEEIWDKPLIEVHAEQRAEHENKIGALQEIIGHWDILIKAADLSSTREWNFTSFKKRKLCDIPDTEEKEEREEAMEVDAMIE